MDLHRNFCLHKNCRLSPGMDHHGHNFLLYIAFSHLFLPAFHFFLFFPFFFYFSILVKSYLYLWELYLLVCITLTNTQVPLDVNTLPPHIMLFFFFFNVASKTLAWRVDHWNTCQNLWWWSWITPKMVECWNLHHLVTLYMYHYWFEMGSLMDCQALFLAICFWIQLRRELRWASSKNNSSLRPLKCKSSVKTPPQNFFWPLH